MPTILAAARRGKNGTGAERRLLSVVVSTALGDQANAREWRASLAALGRQTVSIDRCEVLAVVPRQGPDVVPDLVEVVRQALPQACVLVPDQDLGYGQMKAYAARAASCDLVAFTDADCVVTPDWVGAVLEGFQEAPENIAALQGLTCHADRPGWQAATLQYCGPAWSPAARGRYLVLNNFAIRRVMFERYPFADVRVRQNVERLMVARMLAAGYQIRIEPGMRAVHAYRGGVRAWFHRGRAEAYDRLETVERVHPLTEPPDHVAQQRRLASRLQHHTRRCAETLRDLIRCRRELGVGPAALVASSVAAVTLWAGACVGACQAGWGGSRPPTDF